MATGFDLIKFNEKTLETAWIVNKTVSQQLCDFSDLFISKIEARTVKMMTDYMPH